MKDVPKKAKTKLPLPAPAVSSSACLVPEVKVVPKKAKHEAPQKVPSKKEVMPKVKAGCWYKAEWLPTNRNYIYPLEYYVYVTKTNNEGFEANWYCQNNRKKQYSFSDFFQPYNKMQEIKIVEQFDKEPPLSSAFDLSSSASLVPEVKVPVSKDLNVPCLNVGGKGKGKGGKKRKKSLVSASLVPEVKVRSFLIYCGTITTFIVYDVISLLKQ